MTQTSPSPMTPQLLFSQAYLGLQAGGWKKSTRDGDCVYRGPNGLRCAIGHSIPDEKYQREFEYGEKSLADILKICGFPASLYPFAIKLQQTHDEAEPKDLKASMEDLAEEEGLDIPKAIP